MNVPSRQTILVIGGGFSGSLLAVILHKLGHQVTLIDKSSHPRFAIGESSTPTAGFILRALIEKYDLPELLPLTRYGLWKEELPSVGVGLKRGFSYFFHVEGEEPQVTSGHVRELLVAASSSDAQSDTHWYRQDVDQFLWNYAADQGVTCYADSVVTDAIFDESTRIWQVYPGSSNGDASGFNWIVDASGAGAVMCSLAGDADEIRDDLETDSSAVFAHFQNVKRYDDLLLSGGADMSDFPFPSDNAAQHHMLKSQWLWSLRFDNGVTSLGLVTDRNCREPQPGWEEMLSTYPALAAMLVNAEFDPATPAWLRTSRLQRLAVRGCGPGWVALPHTIGFVDPLHSTGIAHSLSGVERLADIFSSGEITDGRMSSYTEAVYDELKLIDLLIAGCYKLMPSKRHFEAYCMLYFTAAHNYETQRMVQGTSEVPPGIFLSDDAQMVALIREGYQLATRIADSSQWENAEWFEQQIRKLIQPFDQIGLCNPDLHSMYAYTAVL